ncbi:DUF4105 domain-containing protein [Colwellia sp. MB3u-4]|uniref:lipoprotein N-acyltransferase Lnb domain-containing protein n=1 Tax=Colwellia sp. MB3u-4 TaxID=2759822 RepID=UPI0015F7595F|nr:DUF4105 domain-containing protein [Colwellia sp. MB3u-4]MBA6289044.1 DUF4105 domain-containing protein [Colwellia sp. MB3u-4]
MILKRISWLLPALYIFLSASANGMNFQAAASKAAELRLYENPKWLSLLHIKNDSPQIKDSDFILSAGRFSPKNELDETLSLFFDDYSDAKCRFPARYFLLNYYIKFDTVGQNNQAECEELQKYKNYVPFDDINLIYASEVVSSASSMMGHSFLNAKGKNLNQTSVSHSISFFTELDSFNPAALIYDGLVSGMDGFFIVRPFEKDLNHYSKVEGRNVWSYTLDINDFDRTLIKLHIWELKNIEIEYLFQSYNCATLTLYILSLANPNLINEDILFVSPLDVVKAAEKYGMIKNIGVELSDDWALKMLEQEIQPELGGKIESLVFEDQEFSFEKLEPKSKRIAVEYLSYLIKNKVIKSNLTAKRLSKLSDIVDFNIDKSLDFDLSQFKNPINTKQDSILASSLVFDSENTAIDLSFLPASHYLYGDNRQYFSESELIIGEFTVRLTEKSNHLKVQSLTFYSFRTLTPSSKIVPKYSGSFYMGYRQILDRKLNENGFFDLSGGIGKSTKVHKDILLFSNLEVGLAVNTSDSFFYAKPSVGAIINVIADGKIVVEYQLSTGQYDTKHITQALSTKYAWFGIKNWTFHLAHKIYKSSLAKKNEFQLAVSMHF